MNNPLGDRILWEDGDYQLSQCAVCRHKNLGEAACEAFAEGIPAEILRNEVSHAASYDGDGGLVLEPIEIARPLFERMTSLAWPPHAVSYSDVEHLLARAAAGDDVQEALDRALWGLELLTLRQGEGDRPPGQFGLVTVEAPNGSAAVPFFTSLPKMDAWGGSDYLRIRCRFDNFGEELWEEFHALVNPADAVQLVVDPRAIRPD